MQKLYCYVDESGQDSGSKFFVVVAVVSDADRELLRKQLTDIEQDAGTYALKWHKTTHQRRIEYLTRILNRNIAKGCIYTACYHKPIPYFFPMLELIKKSITAAAREPYRTRIYVDGIDRQKAKEVTNALRAMGISLHFVKSVRDESEPIIRLADMWAGCIRGALLDNGDMRDIVNRAKKCEHIRDVT